MISISTISKLLAIVAKTTVPNSLLDEKESLLWPILINLSGAAGRILNFRQLPKHALVNRMLL
jgi:hypothetical protein